MFETLLEAVRRETDGERTLRDLAAIARFHRIQSTPGYDEAAAWLEGALRDAGLTPVRLEVPADGHSRALGFPMPEGWKCTSARALLHGGDGVRAIADFATEPLSIVQRSAPAQGRWPIVVVDDPADLARRQVEGRVVLTSAPAQRMHELAVVARGAAGLICDGRRLMPPVRTSEHDLDSLTYTSFWWVGERPRGWGVVVPPRLGAELRARLAEGESLALEVEFATERYKGTIPLITATIPGPVPGEVLITGHLCHPQPGANDNASGAAAVLECARVLTRLARDGELAADRRTLRFLWMPEFTGTFAWQAASPESVQATVAAVNLDMVGERQDDCGSTFLLERAPHFLGSFADELLARVRSAAQDWVQDFSGEGHYSLTRMAEVPYSGGSDHSLWLDPGIDVPCPMLIQWPDRYYHTNLDTPDRADPAALALAVRSAATYAAFVASAGAQECRWLMGLIARGARRRMLAALEGRSPWQAAEAERERGLRALASLGRLADGAGPDGALASLLRAQLPLAVEELEGFWESEVMPGLARVPRLPVLNGGRVPERCLGGLLSPMRGLTEGWDALGEAVQGEWLAIEATMPGGSTALDLAWFACDGQRGVGDVAAVLVREGHEVSTEALARWFDMLVRAGVARWRA